MPGYFFAIIATHRHRLKDGLHGYQVRGLPGFLYMGSREQSAGSPVYQFGIFELEPATQELRRRGSKLRVHPQPMRLLTVLVARAGETVTREELCHAIWGDEVHVDFTQSLNACVRQVRVVLSDEAEVPRYIETVPRIGYRFIAPVAIRSIAANSSMPQPATRTTAATTPAKPRLRTWMGLALALLLLAAIAGIWVTERWTLSADKTKEAGHADPAAAGTIPNIRLLVLPFRNLTNDARQEYISDGVTEEMITQLGRLSPQNIGVIARTSSMTYKDSGKPLDQIAEEMRCSMCWKAASAAAARSFG